MEKIEFTRSRRTGKIKKKRLERLYEKKPLIELIVTILSIPSLILVVILNFNSLKNINAKPTPTPSTTATNPAAKTTAPNFFTEPIINTPKSAQSDINQTVCNKNLGPITITAPNEGDTLTSNPAEIDIAYNNSTYCSAVWSYRVNGSSWSNYDNNSVALYNLPNGQITFELRAKSLASSDTTTLTRHFIYNGPSTATTPTTASTSAL